MPPIPGNGFLTGQKLPAIYYQAQNAIPIYNDQIRGINIPALGNISCFLCFKKIHVNEFCKICTKKFF